jgi:hypothetical protein
VFTTGAATVTPQARPQSIPQSPSVFSQNPIAPSAWSSLSAFMHDGDDVSANQ